MLIFGSTIRVKETATNTAGTGSATSMVTAVVAAAGNAPANQVLPVVTGSAVQGQTLTVTAGSWSGSPAPTLSEQWQRCDSGGANCVDIAGATGSSYPLGGADLGSTIRVKETATNTAGTGSATSMVTAVVAAAGNAPVNQVLPVVTGSAVQGQTLTVTAGSWSGSPAPTLSEQWQRCDSGGANCVDIAGATGSSYPLGGADLGSTIRVKETATNTAGTGSATSMVTAVVAAAGNAPANQVLPVVTGSAVQGQTLTVTAGSWSGSPAPTLSEQWQRCDSGGANCVDIAGATGSSYLLVGADLGSTIRVKETATNTAGTSSATSMVTAVVAAAGNAPANQVLPVVTGSAVQGQSLTVTAGNWSGSPVPTLSEQWQRCDSGGANCVDIAGATGSSYLLVGADLGSTIRVKETATNTAGTSSATSMVTAVVAAAGSAPVNQVLPVVTGSAVQGQSLTVTAGSWSGSPVPTLSEQWQRCDSGGANCVDIAGATGSSYLLVGADLGSTIRVKETATNTAGTSSATSMVTAVVAAAGSAPVNQVLPVVTGSAVQGQSLTVTAGNWSGSPVPTLSEQWQRCDSGGANCVDIAGATGSSYLLVGADLGSTIRVKETATNTAGTSSATSMVTAVVAAAGYAPVNQVLPVVTGSAVQGQSLTVTVGELVGEPGTDAERAVAAVRQWRRELRRYRGRDRVVVPARRR